MRVLIVDTYYPEFLTGFYASRPGLENAPYAEQLTALMGEHFGTADYYSRNLAAIGYEGQDVVANCEPLQRRWALENGVAVRDTSWSIRRAGGVLPWPGRVRRSDWLWTVLDAQVRAFRPDVLHVHDMNGVPASLLQAVRPYVGLITGQIASAVPANADYGAYDLVLSSLPPFVDDFRKRGLRSEYFRLGFEPRVLEALRPSPPRDLVFVGGFSTKHASRLEFLEALVRRRPVDWWGYGVERLAPDSPLRACYRGPAWGREMYQRLSAARIALNVHGDIDNGYANNMRLYEATGVGALLLTDRKRDLAEIFAPDREVIAYDSPEQCAELATHFLEHEEERATIARAGQARTFAEHTYGHRMQEFTELVRPLLRASRGKVGFRSRARSRGFA